ncbi:Crp/Fnr family transcriptional regulator [Leptospira sp. 96542]|nr:Crp/Fnr family transcriptional regulator [Leptospira sp. 96542]
MSENRVNPEINWNQLYNTVNQISPIPKELWKESENLYTFRKLEYGDFLIKQNATATEFAFVFSGVLKEYYLTDKGNEYIKSFNFAGDFTGSYYDLLSKQPSTCSIRAITNCELAVAKFSEFRKLFSKHIVWERLGRIFAENLFLKKAKREYELLALDAEERYNLLLKSKPGIEMLVPQYQIASYLGITPVSLSRIKSKRKSL